MMEVPAILYQLDDYKNIIDFVSIGTNDLIQYILAVDRNSNVVGHLYSGFHPAVLRVLDDIYYKTRLSGMDVSYAASSRARRPALSASWPSGSSSLAYRRLISPT